MRLGRLRRWTLNITAIGVWLTGGLWLLFHYFFVRQGEFGPQVNASEPWWLRLHGAFAFASIWLFGLLWSVHITVAWPFARLRWSGAVMTGVTCWLILSGYLLYYTGNENARAVISYLHWGIGLACPAAFLWHRLPAWRRSLARKKASTSQARTSVGRD